MNEHHRREQLVAEILRLRSELNASAGLADELAKERERVSDLGDELAKERERVSDLGDELAKERERVSDLEAEMTRERELKALALKKVRKYESSRWVILSKYGRLLRQRPLYVLRHPVLSARKLLSLISPSHLKTSRPSVVKRSPSDSFAQTNKQISSRTGIKALSILDEFSEECFEHEFTIVPAERKNFKRQLEQIDFVLTESAWRANRSEWKYQFNRFTKSNDLDRLLTEASKKSLKTVFWNKEDPINFDTFIDAARRFDFVFTSDEDAIERYKKHAIPGQIHALPFAAQPKIHNPIGTLQSPSDSICFAGAWRGGKYPERARDLGYLLDAAVDVGKLTIFDRSNDQVPRSDRFPSKYQQNILGSLSYKEVLTEYRKHSVHINVNSVTNSSTMLARRVFEILACRTPVVSNPSPAIDKFFGELVLTPTSQSAAAEVFERLCVDSDYRARLGQLGYRTVMENHTYSHRANFIAGTLGFDIREETEPVIDVICVSNRPDFLENALSNFERQTYENKRLIFVANSSSFDFEFLTKRLNSLNDSILLEVSEDRTLGECLNIARQSCEGEYFAKFDDDDLYGSHYLSDIMLCRKFTNAEVFGKKTFHAFLEAEGNTVVRNEGNEFQSVKLVMGGTIVAHRKSVEKIQFEHVPSGTDTRFLKACGLTGLKIFSTDRFNYLMIRRDNVAHHTWKIDDKKFMESSRVIAPGCSEDLVLL